MRKRWVGLIVLGAVICMLMMPAAKVYVHSQLGEEVASLFPATVSVWEVMTKGANCLPTSEIPQLGLINFDNWMLVVGLVFMAISAITLLKGERWTYVSIATAVGAVGLEATFALQFTNVCSSILFTLLLESKIWIYLPIAGSLILAVMGFIELKKAEVKPKMTDRTLRMLSGMLAIAAVMCIFLPAHTVNVSDTLTADPNDAAALNRAPSMLTEILASEGNLRSEAEEKGVYSGVLTGDLKVLEPYSDDGSNIQGIFTISKNTASPNAYMIAAIVLLALCAVLSFIPNVDRWFPLGMSVLAIVCIGASILGFTTVGSDDMFSTATRQICILGLGRLTIAPMLMTLLALDSAWFAALGVSRADEPYFVNPIPKKSRLRFIALTLAIGSFVLVLLPGAAISFTKSGKNKVLATVDITGAQSLTLAAPDELTAPVDSKGKAIYGEEADEGELNADAVSSVMRRMFSSFGITSWITLILLAAGTVAILMGKDKKLSIILFLMAFAVRLIAWIMTMISMPRSIGSASGTVFMYISLPLMLFSAFFSNFVGEEEIPKKYKLFLMMLPFLVAVFLFSYLPLYGWSYAFYNYKFGIPMDQQEFVGFKWFTEMITNQGHRENIVRVLKNTFGMSGLNLVTSILPMIFAIFLNEVGNVRFKKFVQIFTTLPNFISWALVFSFAMAMFAMDTGIFSKAMLAIGAISEPVAWLNSSEHIWIKMWAWSTWKGLGWGAIMYLAAIAGIDQELYEAARVDGANRWKQMRYITLPGLLPTFIVLFMLSVSNILNNGMDQYMVFQNSMNKNTIEVLDLYVYNITIASKGTTLYSFATAIGILKTLVSVTLLFSANFLSKKLRGESIV